MDAQNFGTLPCASKNIPSFFFFRSIFTIFMHFPPVLVHFRLLVQYCAWKIVINKISAHWWAMRWDYFRLKKFKTTLLGVAVCKQATQLLLLHYLQSIGSSTARVAWEMWYPQGAVRHLRLRLQLLLLLLLLSEGEFVVQQCELCVHGSHQLVDDEVVFLRRAWHHCNCWLARMYVQYKLKQSGNTWSFTYRAELLHCLL